MFAQSECQVAREEETVRSTGSSRLRVDWTSCGVGQQRAKRAESREQGQRRVTHGKPGTVTAGHIDIELMPATTTTTTTTDRPLFPLFILYFDNHADINRHH
ncbi:hypothetical protein T07_1218 [Trichinella nelsoni]|uniref:Uncharacterized protein n=1 Tax=Trichinella nelsoni TaxID=6336 RepID=A0A0V0SJJ7_9BILA|nr:hypothetical protein T07_1218 [Trichinella nelsoni]